MQTMQRLTQAYRQAKVIDFDSTSKYVIVSDAHRGDGSVSDEFTKNRDVFRAAMTQYFDNGYTLIEAGDCEDLWEWPKMWHIVKANPLTYSMLRKFHKSGRYLRLFGNHDMDFANPDYVEDHLYERRDNLTGQPRPFLDGIEVHEALRLRHAKTSQEIFVVHGHQGDFWNDHAWRFSKVAFQLFWRYLHRLGIKSPTSPTRNSFQRHTIERNYTKWIRRHGVTLICGHTHRERFPRAGDAPYFNSGSCVFARYITAIEIVNDTISLVTWRVVPDTRGYLQVGRAVMAGPTLITEFDRRPDPSRHKRPSRSLDWVAQQQKQVKKAQRKARKAARRLADASAVAVVP